MYDHIVNSEDIQILKDNIVAALMYESITKHQRNYMQRLGNC